MTLPTKAAPPRAATARRRPAAGRRHSTALPTLFPAGPAAAAARATARAAAVFRPAGAVRDLPAGPEGARMRAGTAPHVTGGTTGPSGAPGTPPSTHPACAGGARRTGAACRPGRAPAGATTPAADASLPADRGLPTGPGDRTTGEGA
ncbi:hypothetical protein ACFYNW_01715 [Streptomyces virginiae]|uniref:hypothetical protein n=1 Tax=Streptomyces virginiae TaxID=1961 RepID=UPI0036E0E761